jgi:Family of unknown function (DUF6056)
MTPASDLGKGGSVFPRLAIGFSAASALTALGIFAYLGTFTRFLADDYCDTMLVTSGSVLGALLNRYLTVSDRYSNLLFDALSEFLAPRNVQVLPPVMILLWTLGLIWLVREIRQLAGFQWPVLLDICLGGLLGFFAVFEAPNRFQTIYWRSAMATHFAPLVYLIALGAFLLLQIRKTGGRRPALWMGVLCFLLAFFGSGFSEPPAAMLVVASSLAFAGVWIWYRGPRRSSALILLASTFAGGLAALLVMKFAPANSFRVGSLHPDFPTLIRLTLVGTFQFIQDSLATLPVPTLVSFMMPLLLFYGLYSNAPTPGLSARSRWILLLLIFATPLLMYLMIAASFAPSIYGQSYPVERARFAGRFMLTSACIVEGVFFGVLIAQWRQLSGRSILANIALSLLVISAFYPFRAGWTTLQANLSNYQQWSSAWDARQGQILAEKAQGKQDIVVPQLPGIAQIKELDTRPNFWVNRCAANFYGVNSISAPPIHP